MWVPRKKTHGQPPVNRTTGGNNRTPQMHPDLQVSAKYWQEAPLDPQESTRVESWPSSPDTPPGTLTYQTTLQGGS